MNDLDLFIDQLKEIDNIAIKRIKNIQKIFWIYIPLFSIFAIIVFFTTRNFYTLIELSCLIISFLLFLLINHNWLRDFQNTNPSLPTLLMLKKVAKRYQAIQLKNLWSIIPLLIIDISFIIKPNSLYTITQFQIFYFGIIVIGYAIGFLIWYFKYKPIRDKVLSLIREIEEN